MGQMLSINPATEEVMGKFDYISGGDAAREVLKSREAFLSWGNADVRERCALLKKAAAVLKKNRREYGELISREMGKPVSQSVPEVEKCAWACEYYAENAEKFLADEPVRTESGKAYVMFQPLGTILGIMPWNFPFWQVFRFASAALASGNTVVVKHSSNVPQCGIAIEGVFREAGFPEHVYKNLLLSSGDIEPLVGNGLVEGISLTGSTEAGRRVGELGGKWLKKVVLELGGNDPFIVLDDSEVEKASEAAVTARFQNCGQSCIAGKRFIVHQGVADAFIESFVRKAQALRVGDPLDPKTGMGPLARADLREKIEAQLKAMEAYGARVLAGGKRIPGKGYFYEPTVVDASGVRELRRDGIKARESGLVREETFGPLATVIVGKDDEELLAIANASPYGLASSVWGSRGRAEGIARRLENGMVAVNGMARSDPRLPFGGVKDSGIGRELGRYGILEFVNVKSVAIS
ncbi:MAG: NAD-dependent succinate-semialdehyde dehydrogenase [Candidatus Micrarchaeota archaeon]